MYEISIISLLSYCDYSSGLASWCQPLSKNGFSYPSFLILALEAVIEIVPHIAHRPIIVQMATDK